MNARRGRGRKDNDQHPHDPRRSAAQIAGLLQLLGKPHRKVLDLGCGIGRVLLPLAEAGHAVTGIDRDGAALARCRRSLEKRDANATLIQADFLELPRPRARFDAAICLGNTFMTIADVGQAVHVLGFAAALLKPGGFVLIDDFPFELWGELTRGDWQDGISPDGAMQMVWQPGDSVFAIRRGKAVDPSDWRIGPRDSPCRLWCMGSLALAARAAGLSAPRHEPGMGALVMSRARP